MNTPRSLCPFAWVLWIPLLALAVPHPATSQPLAPGLPELAPEVRAGLSQAASDAKLPPWQRDFMLRLARWGKTSALDSAATATRAGLPARALEAADGAWTELTPAGTPPSARYYHSAVYDPLRDHMVVFGGYGDGYFSDVWVLSLAGTPAWTLLAPVGTPPSARVRHSAIYDPVRDRMLVFGGYYYEVTDHYLNDVWALSLAGTPAWTVLTPVGTPPSGRSLHSAIYDPERDRMVVFGGVDDISLHSDVWVLSLAGTPAWTALTPTGVPPSGRGMHSAVYDPVRDRMVVFGGRVASGYLNDVWTLSLAGAPAWMALTPTGTPPSGRSMHSAIYDAVRDRMVAFAGEGTSGYLNDVWALSLAGPPAWAALTPTGTPPSARYCHSAILDPVRGRMVAFGGYDGGYYRNDVWALGWGAPAGLEDPARPPLISCLRSPVPNPFHGTTTVAYSIAQAGQVELGVYDMSGRLIRRLVDGGRHAGTETVVWDGTSKFGARLGTGVYFVRLAGPGIRETRKVILLR